MIFKTSFGLLFIINTKTLYYNYVKTIRPSFKMLINSSNNIVTMALEPPAFPKMSFQNGN